MLTIYPRFKLISLAPLVIALLLVVGGCENIPTADQGAYTTSESGIQQARDLVIKSQSLQSPEKDRLLLRAVELYLSDGKPKSALKAFQAIDQRQLNEDRQFVYGVVSGELAIATQQITIAAPLLSSRQNSQLLSRQPVPLRIRWHTARADLFARQGAGQRTIFELTRLSPLLGDRKQIEVVHNRIWATLAQLSDEEVGNGVTQSADPVVAGWYKLTANIRLAEGDLTGLIEEFQRWKQHNAAHPAARTPPANLQRIASFGVSNIDRVALFLPEEGDYQLAAQTLTEGFLSAYYLARESAGNGPDLRFYDTSSDDMPSLYQRAIADGAQLVIGPLSREKLSEILLLPSLTIPVLGLNYLENPQDGVTNLAQFGLSAGDESKQIAADAWAAGYRSAIVIAPNSRMGQSATEEFNATWHKLGGRVQANTVYNTSQHDYAELLETPLLIRQSKQRAVRLKRLLGKNFEFTPRRRGDIDMAILVSYPEQGRQIKPALNFLYAADLQVFATSHIYAGKANPELDVDLDNILFTAMPWMMERSPLGMASPPADLPVGYKNLFAMGADAYRLHLWLPLLKELPDTEIHGLTGNMMMIEGNRIERRLPWARFKNGKVKLSPAVLQPVIASP